MALCENVNIKTNNSLTGIILIIVYNIVYNIENSFKPWNFNPYLTETYIGFDDSDIFLGYIPKCPLQRKFCSK